MSSIGFIRRSYIMTSNSDSEKLLLRTIKGVLRHSQDGELPLFGWTLGMNYGDLAELHEHCYPELGVLPELAPTHYMRTGCRGRWLPVVSDIGICGRISVCRAEWRCRG